nr:TatD family hydrolase [Actinomycetota bacterium]
RVIDTHAHLDGCDEPLGELLSRARAVGVTRVVTIGTGIESSRTALALADEHDGVYAAVGIDPHQAGGEEAARVDELRKLLAHPKAVAVGETGLDNFHDFATPAEQLYLFEAQIELATETNLPLVIHSRDADEETAAALTAFDGTVVLHCFSSAGLLPTALERGYYVSFAGNFTYPKAVELREAAAQVPAERILAETDSPYLAPRPLRGRPNEPAYITHTVAALAEARGEDAAELAAQIDANATAAFGL